jgi:hypothetical protein
MKDNGLSIGGMKYNLNKSAAPKEKNGEVLVEGKPFIDEKGRKVIMTKGLGGEMQYEVEEEYIDENGMIRKQNKIITMRKDTQGNEVEVTEYIDPKTGKKMKKERKVYKDENGN